MRKVVAVVTMMALAAAAGYAARDMQRPDGSDGSDAETCLPNADWLCADVRLDGFSLPLEPYCVEYVHKSRALPKAKAGDGE